MIINQINFRILTLLKQPQALIPANIPGLEFPYCNHKAGFSSPSLTSSLAASAASPAGALLAAVAFPALALIPANIP
jgi:hypothetical protein